MPKKVTIYLTLTAKYFDAKREQRMQKKSLSVYVEDAILIIIKWFYIGEMIIKAVQYRQNKHHGLKVQ